MSIVKAGAGVIVINKEENRVLIGKRKNCHGEGLYAFPGGHLEATDPSLKLAGEREVLEETGIVCSVFKPDGIRDELFTTFDILSDKKDKIYVTTYLIAKYVSGGEFIDNNTCVALEPDKCEKWIWVTLKELRELVQGYEANIWIPMRQVNFYLFNLLRNST